MIDHVSVAVSDLADSANFYTEVLEPLGMARMVDREATVGFGKKYPEFWLNARPDMMPVDVCLCGTKKNTTDQLFSCSQ